MSRSSLTSLLVVGALALASACGGKTPPAISPTTPPPGPQAFPGAGGTPSTRPPVPQAPDAPPVISAEPLVVSSDPLATMDTDEINRQAPLGPVFFTYDSDSVDAEGQKVLTDNAAIIKKYPTWAITIEGHSDERGTAEYNLALGERRALSAKSYLLSLGISADRIRTVSYGKEFPFDPGHDEAAYSKNRRGHFVVTAK
ncbi:MAG: peptidoglycan-associated lipoprotein Pal [Acidobacteria bacterium]|nr:peptidoglycan-associated lipoprotein Pal [Acidobacteriota bacterium]